MGTTPPITTNNPQNTRPTKPDQTTITTGMENARGTESPEAAPVSGKSPTTGPKGGPTFGTKLSQHK